LLSSLLALRAAAPTPKVDRICGDFAAAWNEKPASMSFVGCEQISSPPGEGLRATYLVDGAAAAEVEEFLQREFGLPSLAFVCCYWTTSNVGGPAWYYIDETETSVSIDMHSEEAVRESPGRLEVLNRQDWHKLRFYVYVEKVWGI